MSDDDRFSQYGKLAPVNKGNFVFVQHMNGKQDIIYIQNAE